MLGLSAIVAAITQLIQLPVTWLLLHDTADTTFSFDSNTTTDQDVSYLAGSFAAAGISVVVTLVAGLILTGILTVVVSRAVLGQRISGAEAWAQARPRLPALFGVTALVFLIVIGVLTVSVVPGVLLGVAGAGGGATLAVVVIGLLGGVAAAVYVYVLFALAPVAVVLERAPVMRSLSRSRTLVQGKWWRVFGILLLVNVLAQIIATVLNIPFTVLTLVAAWLSGSGDSLNPYHLLPLVISSLGTIVGYAITWPFTSAATALLYVDQRMRREGLDLELARASGVTLPSAPASPSYPQPPRPPGPGW
jgi:hypothetical protein